MSAKYPRSLHLPFSPGASSDDKMMTNDDVEKLMNVEVIVTEKLDGSNVCLTKDFVFSRSHGGEPAHKSFAPLKQIHKYLKESIPENYSIFGEWCYAVHSIEYTMLQDHLNIFGVRDDNTGEWAKWSDVVFWAEILGASTVPLILRGVFSDKENFRKVITELSQLSSVYGKTREGLVVRVNEGLYVNELNQMVGLGKWVRKGHVQTDEHWQNKPVAVQPAMLKI